MQILSPIWLIGLAPWLALALGMLRGRGTLQRVPFLKLWGGPVAMPKSDRPRQLPPISLIAALIALLLGVIAAGRLAVGRYQQATVNLIVDRGSSMSVRDLEPRFVFRCDSMLTELEGRWPRSRVNLTVAPGETYADLSLADARNLVHRQQPTAVDTTGALDQLIHSQISNRIVISNQVRDVPNDVGIVGLALATQPRLQLMIRLQNESKQASTLLRITSSDRIVEQTVALSPAQTVKYVFVDLDRIADTIKAELPNADGNPVNKTAWLVRESSRRQPEVRTPLAPAVQRVIDVYRARRAGSGTIENLPIVGSVPDLGDSEPGLIVPKPIATTASQPAQIASHAIIDHVDWKSLPASVQIADAPEGWTPIISLGAHVCVAVNPQQPKQVWAGLESDAWSTTPDFVIFWTNILDYAGGGSDMWVSHPLSDWSPEWKLAGEDGGQPGIYVRSDGARRAFNASELPAKLLIVEDWQSQLDKIQPESAAGEIAPALLIAALGLIALFAIRF